MPLLTRKQPSGKSSPAVTTPPSGNGSGGSSGKSLTQAQLDLICRPTPTYYRTFVRWTSRLADRETYPTETLVERAYELGPELAALKRQVWQPAEATTGDEWTALRERLSKLEAQMKAIEWTLERRQKTVRSRRLSLSASPSSAPSPTPGTEAAAPEPDPFTNE